MYFCWWKAGQVTGTASSGCFICMKSALPSECLFQGIHRHPQISEGGEMGNTYFKEKYLGKEANTAVWDREVSGHGQQEEGAWVTQSRAGKGLFECCAVSWRCQVDYRDYWLHEHFKIDSTLTWKGRFGVVGWQSSTSPDCGCASDELGVPAGARKTALERSWGPTLFLLAARTYLCAWAPLHPPERGRGEHLIPTSVMLWGCLSPSRFSPGASHCGQWTQEWDHTRKVPLLLWEQAVSPSSCVLYPSWLSLHPDLALCWKSLTPNLPPQKAEC